MNTYLQPQADKQLTTTTLDNYVNEWLEYERQANDASDNTIAAYDKGMTVFREWLNEQNLNLAYVTAADVLDFKSYLSAKFSAQTVNLRLTAIRSFYRFCVGQGYWIKPNPASEIKGAKRSKSKQHKRDALTDGEVLHVLSQPDTSTAEGLRDKAILTLLSRCALRAVEIHRANIGDLRTRGNRLTLDVWGKGRKEADEYVIIPIKHEQPIRAWLKRRVLYKDSRPGDSLFISLSNRSKGQRLSLRAIRGIVKDYYKSAGVADEFNKKSTHSLRHSAITNAIRKGATPLQVQSMARHQSFDTTLNYYHEVSRLDNPAEDMIDYEG